MPLCAVWTVKVVLINIGNFPLLSFGISWRRWCSLLIIQDQNKYAYHQLIKVTQDTNKIKYLHIHTYIHTYIHTDIHTYIHTPPTTPHNIDAPTPSSAAASLQAHTLLTSLTSLPCKMHTTSSPKRLTSVPVTPPTAHEPRTSNDTRTPQCAHSRRQQPQTNKQSYSMHSLPSNPRITHISATETVDTIAPNTLQASTHIHTCTITTFNSINPQTRSFKPARTSLRCTDRSSGVEVGNVNNGPKMPRVVKSKIHFRTTMVVLHSLFIYCS